MIKIVLSKPIFRWNAGDTIRATIVDLDRNDIREMTCVVQFSELLHSQSEFCDNLCGICKDHDENCPIWKKATENISK